MSLSSWAEKVSGLLRQEPGLSKDELIKRCGGDARFVDAALGELILVGHIRIERQEGRGFVQRFYLEDEKEKRIAVET
jgi:hypothetical protein